VPLYLQHRSILAIVSINATSYFRHLQSEASAAVGQSRKDETKAFVAFQVCLCIHQVVVMLLMLTYEASCLQR
jgi:hypothetical protein